MKTRLSKNDVLNYSSSLSLLNINSVCLSRSVMSNSFDSMDCSPHSSVCGDSPGKNTGVGCHFLLQGISLTQGSNLDLLHCRQILYCLSYQGTLNTNSRCYWIQASTSCILKPTHFTIFILRTWVLLIFYLLWKDFSLLSFLNYLFYLPWSYGTQKSIPKSSPYIL